MDRAIHVFAFYQFADLPDYAEWRAPLLQLGRDWHLRGSILLASEGINGTVAGTEAGIRALASQLRADARFARLEGKTSYAEELPFKRYKVRLKREIVTLGVPDVDPTGRVGTYVDPEAWNELISDPDVLIVDTRNDYEVRMGTFSGAINPATRAFGEFPAFVERELASQKSRRVAMFCTGGIRCEKATSYLLSQGFEDVYHLRGGILRYLEVVDPDESLWQGACFVFDERYALDPALRPVSACPLCHRPLAEGACLCASPSGDLADDQA